MLQLRISSRTDYEMIALSDFYEKKEGGHRHLESIPSGQSILTGYGIMTKEDFSVCPRCQAKMYRHPCSNLQSALNIKSHSYAKSISQRSVAIPKGKFVENSLHYSHQSWYLNLHFPGQKPAFLCGWHKSPSFAPQSSLEIICPTESIQNWHIQYFLITDQQIPIKYILK